MRIIELLIKNKLDEAKKIVYEQLNNLVQVKLTELKKIKAENSFPLDEASSNLVKSGRIIKIRRRIRRNAKGRIVVQRNRRKSSIEGYRIAGNTVRRIPATVRLRKQRLLKRSWKTTRRGKLRRTLIKRRMSMRRRTSMGIK